MFIIAGLALLALVFRDVDVDAVVHAVSGIGYAFPGIAAVYLLGCIFDVLGWRRLMPSSGRGIPFYRLLAVHIAGESFYRFIPAGAVIGDSVKVLLSRKLFRIDSSQAVSSLLLRKLFMGTAQVFYIGTAVVLGILMHGVANAGSLELTGGVLAVALFALFAAMAFWMMKGTLCMSVFTLLMRLPSKRVREALRAHRHMFIETDALLHDVLRSRRGDVLASMGFFFCNWMTELLETFLILLALGAAIPVTGTMLFEPVISLVRSIAFIFPGGLGVMDAGYASALQMYNVPNAAILAAAFIVVKRSKEIVWIIVGIALAMILGDTPEAAGSRAASMPPA